MTKLEEWGFTFGHTKVISRSNEDEPFMVGELVRFEAMCGVSVPIVECAGIELGVMGVVIPWTQEVADFLTFLEPKKQWEILSNISMAVSIRKGRS